MCKISRFVGQKRRVFHNYDKSSYNDNNNYNNGDDNDNNNSNYNEIIIIIRLMSRIITLHLEAQSKTQKYTN